MIELQMISVLFSTYNGAATLPRMLEALCRIEIPDGGWKLIAIDNASTDNTHEILTAFSNRLPLTVLYHPVRGKNSALNAALPHVEGELIVFIDDDVLPEVDWLVKLTDAAQKNPEFDLFGGTILPEWPKPPPEWILRHVRLAATYALTPVNLAEGEISPLLIWGPNMMVRANLFKDGNKFNEAIGPKEGSYVMGSETEFNMRMAALGHRCWHSADAKLKHIIRHHQLSRKWILQRAIRSGKGICAMNQQSDAKNFPCIFGVPRWMIMKAAIDFFHGHIRGAVFDTPRSFKYMWNVYYFVGYASHARAK